MVSYTSIIVITSILGKSILFFIFNILSSPVVTYYNCDTCDEQVSESVVFISPDLKHGHDAIHEYKELLSIHLQQQRGLRFNELIHLSNGCSSQYKSKGPLADIAHSSEDYDFKISHHYYGSRHGKGASVCSSQEQCI